MLVHLEAVQVVCVTLDKNVIVKVLVQKENRQRSLTQNIGKEPAKKTDKIIGVTA